MEDLQSDSIFDIARGNTQTFLEEFDLYDDVEQFLRRPDDRFISYRSMYLTDAETSLGLNYKLDTDGIVVEIDSLSAIKFPFRYVQFLPNNENSVLPVFNILKKHLSLTNYSVETLKRCIGIQLVSDAGWQIITALVPDSRMTIRRNNFKEELTDYFKSVRQLLQQKVLELGSEDLCRSTFKKNKVSQIKSWHVLPEDRSFILELLHNAFVETECPPGLERKYFGFRFGERETGLIYLNKDFEINNIISISIHTAVTVSSVFPNMHLTWAREGVEEIVGNRGVLNSVFSFREVCNFQSNLDGRAIDIKADLQQVCKYPEKITFIQLYVDSPHLYANCIHPVSGGIITCGLLHKETMGYLRRQAEEYLLCSRENCMKLTGNLNIRLEAVTRLTDVPDVIVPSAYICTEKLKLLLTKHPMIVPFFDSSWTARSRFMDSLRNVATYIYDNLYKLKEMNWRRGGFIAGWSSYQLELANEMFWWGKPNSYQDAIYSVNLGPGISGENRSTTHSLGFLRLDAVNACAVDEQSIPPLHYWTRQEIDTERVKRLFTFSDFLSCSDRVLGSRLLITLCGDVLTDRRRRIEDRPRSLLSDLRGERIPSWAELRGCIGVKQLSERLCKREQFKFPYVFGHALGMLSNERNVRDVIEAGLECLKLNFFLSFQSYDSHRNLKFCWIGNGLVRVLHSTCELNEEIDYQVITSEIIDIMDKRDLVHRSKFLQNKVHVFPWIELIYDRLKVAGLQKRENLLVFTFVSCIGLLQNGKFVHLANMKDLLQELPVSQTRLQSLKILSQNRLPNVFYATVYCLCESIPVLIELVEKKDQRRTRENEILNEETDIIDRSLPVVENGNREEVIYRVAIRRHVPGASLKHWTSDEINVIALLLDDKTETQTWRSLYRLYTETCHKNGLADRSFFSFKSACLRLLEKRKR